MSGELMSLFFRASTAVCAINYLVSVPSVRTVLNISARSWQYGPSAATFVNKRPARAR